MDGSALCLLFDRAFRSRPPPVPQMDDSYDCRWVLGFCAGYTPEGIAIAQQNGVVPVSVASASNLETRRPYANHFAARPASSARV